MVPVRFSLPLESGAVVLIHGGVGHGRCGLGRTGFALYERACRVAAADLRLGRVGRWWRSSWRARRSRSAIGRRISARTSPRLGQGQKRENLADELTPRVLWIAPDIDDGIGVRQSGSHRPQCPHGEPRAAASGSRDQDASRSARTAGWRRSKISARSSSVRADLKGPVYAGTRSPSNQSPHASMSGNTAGEGAGGPAIIPLFRMIFRRLSLSF